MSARRFPLPSDGKIIRWLACPDCKGRGWFLENPFAAHPTHSGNVLQCRICQTAYEAHAALAKGIARP